MFRYYSIGSSVIFGWIFARYTTDHTVRCSNEFYNRPDLKPFAAMVEKPNDMMTRTMIEAQYNTRQEGNYK